MNETHPTRPLMVAAADLLRLPLEPAFEPGIMANLEVARKMAALLERYELDDEAEPAPVYRP
jgi:hypothetical protein